jgi:hypothetical protein
VILPSGHILSYFLPQSSPDWSQFLPLSYHPQMTTLHPTLTPIIPQVWTLKYLRKLFRKKILSNAYIGYSLFSHIISICYSVGSNMSPKKRVMSKVQNTKVSSSNPQDEDKPEVVGPMYDDTFGLLEKGGETLKWGNVYQMFKKK